MKLQNLALMLVLLAAITVKAEDLLVKVTNPVSTMSTAHFFSTQSQIQAEPLTEEWIRIRGNLFNNSQVMSFLQSKSVLHVQKNYKIKSREIPHLRENLLKHLAKNPMDLFKVFGEKRADNPEIPGFPNATTGADPLFNKQWGMSDIGVKSAWKFNPGSNNIVVAVIDTGVDYTHEDLLPNLWRNSKEIPNNGIDDDNNGYIDDVIGWDFVGKDNKPYDLAASSFTDLLNGGNPGHGTHCAGNVAAKANNGKGIVGVSPNAQIMAIRFLGDKGGTTADAVLAVKYAVDNGAKVLSNSWGSEGEDPEDAVNNQALKDVIQYAADRDVLFIAAAGNGHQGAGYNNDTDSKPAYPASYEHENIISVAALDSSNNFGSFSNWGVKSVDIGAPGVKVFSTTVGGKYSDTVIPFLATWDGTSMATPHVAGAAALYWSAHPEKTHQEVKTAIMNSAIKIPSAAGKVVTEGKLSVENLMKQ